MLVVEHYLDPTERANLCGLIRNPQLYRGHDIRQGPAHIFQFNAQGQTQRDPAWKNNKRLESHGLALATFCRELQEVGVECRERLAEAIVLLTGFFSAIDYPSAPSAGCWEELVFEGGLTWDTEAIRTGLEGVERARHNSDTRDILTRAAKTVHERDGLDLERLVAADTEIPDLIERGAERVRRTYFCESEQRPIDASLLFVALSGLEPWPTRDSVTNALARTCLLLRLEQALLRDKGMLRYAPFVFDGRVVSDSYLSCNYWTYLDQDGYLDLRPGGAAFGSSDASDAATYIRRADAIGSGREAEWFLVSELAAAWLRVAGQLDHTPEQQLKRICLEHAHAALEVALSRAVGDDACKSNGANAPPWSVPEAFEWVHFRTNGTLVECLLPGVNTPLAWAAASLRDCLQAFVDASSVYAFSALA
jgi:hypothetical protein